MDERALARSWGRLLNVPGDPMELSYSELSNRLLMAGRAIALVS